MYREVVKKESRNYWKYSTFALSVIVLALSSFIFYGFLKTDEFDSNSAATENTQSQQSSAKSNQSSTVALLGQTKTQSTTQGATPTATKVASLNLPDGWIQGDIEIEPDFCTNGKTMQKTSYSKDTMTISMYERTSTENCKPLSIQDVTLDFDFSTDGSAITIPTDALVFCTKEQNQQCPKGDGKVSIYADNIDGSSQIHVLNSQTNKSYIFVVIDSSVSGDTDAQARELASIVSSAFQIK